MPFDAAHRLLPALVALAATVSAAPAQDAGTATEAGADQQIIESHAYSTFGDVKYPADFQNFDYVNVDAPKGGEISVWAQGTFDSFNPFTVQGRAGSLSSMPYERLMTDAADDAYASYCLLCETIEYPESEDWVIFNLRPEARFSDGTPVTAEDVVFTVNLFLEQGLPSFREAVSTYYESVEALDEHTVKFTFTEGIPRKTLISQAGSTIVFSKDWFEETGARLDEPFLEVPVGSGPYVLDSYDINRQIVYARNPDYWGADLPINQGRFNFDRIRVEYFLDASASLEAFKAGEYTFRQETSSLVWATQYEFPKIEQGVIVKEALPNGNLPPASGFVFNLRREKFQDPRVRRALSLMFNFTFTNEQLQYGLFEQRNSFWEGSDLEARGVPEGAELEMLESLGDRVDASILTEAVVTAHESGERQLDRRNLRQAFQLMEEAGWVPGEQGMLRKDGQTLEVEFLIDSPDLERIILPYIDNLRSLGVDATLERVDPAQYTLRTREFDFDMIYDRYLTGLEEGRGIAQRFGSERAEYSIFNPAGFGDAGVDALIEEVIDAETLEEMQAAVRGIDRIMRAERFVVPTWYNPYYWVAYYDMYEHPEPLPPYELGHLDFWWYNAERAEELRAAGAL